MRPLLALFLLLAAVAAHAQEGAAPAVVRATGKATIVQPANLLVLPFERAFEGESFLALTPQVRDFRADFIAGLNEKLEQATLRITATLDPITPARILVTGAIVLNFGPILAQTDGETALARALDQALALFTEHSCISAGIQYEMADDTALRQAAVEKATENAFLPGESVARALRTDIYTVDEVRLVHLEITSGPPPLSAQTETPTGREVTCTAEVEVSYLLLDRN